MEVVLAVVCVGVCGGIIGKVCHWHPVQGKEWMSREQWKKYFNEGGDI